MRMMKQQNQKSEIRTKVDGEKWKKRNLQKVRPENQKKSKIWERHFEKY